MIDEELLSILACPDTHQPLRLADAAALERANAAIAAGTQKNAGGEPVTDALEAGLLREDGKILYPIREGIPILLIEEGLPLGG
jgi:uncharacterized protein YbaR (Trm112 family)